MFVFLGLCNNLQNPTWGMFNIAQLRQAPATWETSKSCTMNNYWRIDSPFYVIADKRWELTYRQNLKWRPIPTKWRECSLCQTLQVRVTSDTLKIQSSDWPKWRCALWRNINNRIFVGHRTSFQAVCRHVNLHPVSFFCQLPIVRHMSVFPNLDVVHDKTRNLVKNTKCTRGN